MFLYAFTFTTNYSEVFKTNWFENFMFFCRKKQLFMKNPTKNNEKYGGVEQLKYICRLNWNLYINFSFIWLERVTL